MWNICRIACPNSASDKISEYSRNIIWNKQSTTDKNIKQYDDKKIMVVDTQPYNSVVSRVVNSAEPVVGRKKITPDCDLIKSLDSNDFVLNSRPNSQERKVNIDPTSIIDNQQTDNKMNSDESQRRSEYNQSFTWNQPMTQTTQHFEERVNRSEYSSAFRWPNVPKEVPPIEPIFERAPGRAVQVESSAKKSATISNFAEVIGKPDFTSRESQPLPSTELKTKKSEYNAKFRPFSAYVYVPGNGFKQPKNLDRLYEADKAQNWTSEREERNRQANHYKTRSQLGHPLNSEGLEQIYSHGSIWNNYHIDRDLQALSLATTQMIIQEKKAEKNVRAQASRSKSAAPTRLLNSAPPSLRSEAPIASSHASVYAKSPNTTYRPRSAEKHHKTNATTEASIEKTPKTEGKIWLKPKKLTQEPSDHNVGKKVSDKTPKNSNEINKSKSPAENGGPKSPRPTSLTSNNGNTTNGGNGKVPIPPFPSGPVRTTQVKSPEEITGVKSPSPESWTVPIDKGLNWMNGETPNNFDSKYDSNMGAIKPTPVNEKFQSKSQSNNSETKVIPEEKTKKSKTPFSLHSKPTAKVQPSPSSSSVSSPVSKYNPIEEEVKVVKPVSARQKASNVLDKARNRMDLFWSRNK